MREDILDRAVRQYHGPRTIAILRTFNCWQLEDYVRLYGENILRFYRRLLAAELAHHA